MPTRTRQQGFTIVELIVTVSILGLMLFLVNSLFNDTSVAVTTSVQTSKTIAQSRSINEQMTADGDAMQGPAPAGSDGGYIVIIQQFLPDITMLDPQNLSESQVAGLRSDQVVFIRNAADLRSMTPATASSYRTSLIGQGGAARAKVWYGHPQRTRQNPQPDGQRRTVGTDLGLGGADAEFDRIGSDFILGRQAMLFNPTGLDPSVNTHATSAYSNAAVAQTAFTPAADRFAYMGLTDVTSQDYSGLVTQLTNNAADSVAGATDTIDYLRTSYLYERLHVNPAPDPGETNYASWAIAQGHPILAQSCSEIIIDFAADLDGDGQIDTDYGDQSNNASAPIYWYDALRQPNLGVNAAGQWTQQTPAANFPQPYININANTKAFIFRVDDILSFEDAGGTLGTAGTAHSYWPYLIRIRYRLHDTRGRLTGNYNEVGVDNNGDGNIDEVDDDKISGRWFERIISVPRP